MPADHTEGLLIRPAQPADAVALGALLGLAPAAIAPEEIEQRLRAILREPDHALFVAAAETQLAGLVHGVALPLLGGGWTAKVVTFGLAELQSRGNAAAGLLRVLEVWAQERGCASVRLSQEAATVGSAEFWHSLGYGERLSAITLGKTLPA